MHWYSKANAKIWFLLHSALIKLMDIIAEEKMVKGKHNQKMPITL